MEELPKSVIARLQAQAPPQEHPDADLLAAFSEQALSGGERERVLAHLAACAACREAVALAAPQPAMKDQASVLVPWYRRPRMFAWAGTLATLALVGALLLNYGHERSAERTVTDAMPAQTAAPPPPSGQPAAAEAPKAITDGTLAKQEPERRDLASTKTEPKQKALPEEPGRREMASSQAAAPPQVKDQKKGDGGALQNQYSLKRAIPPPARAPAAAPAAPLANAVTDEVQASAANQAVAAKAAPAARADTSGAALGGLMYPSRAARMAQAPPPLWSISEKGKLQRSVDQGQSWQPVLTNESTVFRVVSVVGSQVWAGGSGAALFHSSDGASWSRQTLPGASADVVSLGFNDAQNGVAGTADGSAWHTSDGGRHWTKQ